MDEIRSKLHETISSLNHASRKEWWRDRFQIVDRHRMWISFWCCLSFIGLGVCLVVFAPTLLDIAHQLEIGVGLLSVALLTRALGGVVGTVGSGILMDMFPRVQNTLFLCFLLGGIAANSLVPAAGHIGVLAVVMFTIGVTLGGVDNGAHAILMKLWGKDSGPCMQFLHAAFALGAFIAPLIAKPFITDITDNEELNNSFIFNISCTDLDIEITSSCDGGYSVECLCIDSIEKACNKTSALSVTVYHDLTGNQTTCTQLEDDNLVLNYGWAYWIAASLFVIPTIAFIYYSIRYDFIPHRQRKRERVPADDILHTGLSDNERETVSAEAINKDKDEGNEEGEEVREEENEGNVEEDKDVLIRGGTVGRDPETHSTLRTYKYPAFFILFWFMFSYVGSEVAYGSLLFTYTVKSDLKFDKQTAATVTAVFWGFFTFMRTFSIALALMKVRASVMMSLNVSGSVTAILILSVFPHNVIVVWICSALLGASFASIFPTTMAWMSEHLPVSGKASAVLNGGGNIGDIIVPSAIAALIGNVHPDSFVYSVITLIFISTSLLILLFAMTAVYKRRHRQSTTTRDYHRLRTISTQPSQNGVSRSETKEESTVI